MFPHSGGKAHLGLFSSAKGRSSLWILYHFPEMFIEYSTSWRNELTRQSFSSLGCSRPAHSSFLPYYIISQHTSYRNPAEANKGSCVFGQRSGSNHNTSSFVTAFLDYNFQQIRVLNLVWRMKGKLNVPRKYYHKPLLTIFLHFDWSLNYGITRHYAKNPICLSNLII